MDMLESPNDKSPVAVRVRALRTKLGWSQEELALRAAVHRVNIVRVETGSNKLSSYAMRAALARGFGLTLEDVNAFLAGRLSIKQALSRRAA